MLSLRVIPESQELTSGLGDPRDSLLQGYFSVDTTEVRWARTVVSTVPDLEDFIWVWRAESRHAGWGWYKREAKVLWAALHQSDPTHLDSHLWQPCLPHVGEGVKEAEPLWDCWASWWSENVLSGLPVLYPSRKLSKHGLANLIASLDLSPLLCQPRPN